MIKKLFFILLALILVFVVVAALQPADFRITRSATIAAPPATLFKHINDLHLWQEWSPWAKIDPDCKVTFEGPAAGPGAIFRWNGNDKVGQGSMTLTDSKASELVRYNLEFLKPFEAKNIAEFGLKPEGQGTVVTWTMSGTNGFIGKAFGLIINCDKMVGGDFEKGLASLKVIAESEVKK